MDCQIGGNTVVVGGGNEDYIDSLVAFFQTKGFRVRVAEDGEKVLRLLEDSEKPCLLAMDVWMPNRDGLDTLRELRSRDNGISVLLVSKNPVPPRVMEQIRRQNAKLLVDPFCPDDLFEVLPDSVVGNFDRPAENRPPIGTHIQGNERYKPFNQRIENFASMVASSDVPVLLMGETGAGKEVLARQIHRASARARSAFVKINCAALPSELIESELFGYERGAFSGAFVQRQGLFETANGGTILLDEIGDMDIRLQPKLLQVLQDGEFRRVGGRELLKVDVRIMAATHQDLSVAMRERRFREDLFYRLNVVSIRVPSLRERRDEITSLAEFFLRKYSTLECPALGITTVLREAMLNYGWPGNVRELENLMRKYLIIRNPFLLSEELRTIEANLSSAGESTHFGPAPQKETGGDFGSVGSLQRVEEARREAEREAVLNALRSTNWNRKKAAQLLHIDYKALLYKMKKLAIGAEKDNRMKPPGGLPMNAQSASVLG